jgi:3-oxoacyl-[acyl-carrier-protein] synthase II
MDKPLITGLGIVSSLGEGLDAHEAALNSGAAPELDSTRFPHFPFHPMVALELDKQIPRKGDQRQMEPWQRLGTYAAGLALDQAGLKGDSERLARTDMIVAATGGERDWGVDEQILTGYLQSPDPGAFLNERLGADLRPTLFLAQLPNLLAGNISIVHGVVGSSRTLLGEDNIGADALHTASARIRAGQSEIALVGASYSAARPDTLLNYQFASQLYRGEAPGGVWDRLHQGGGIVFGSAAVFFVLESPAHAAARGAVPLARIEAIETARGRRGAGEASAIARAQLERLPLDRASAAIMSACTGAKDATAEELAFLRETGLPFRAAASRFGHTADAGFLTATAMAVLALRAGTLPPAFEAAETGSREALRQVVVNGWGHWRGEAAALLRAV